MPWQVSKKEFTILKLEGLFKGKNFYLYHYYLFIFPGTGLGIESIGLGVELLRGEQRTSKCFLFVTTRPMSLLRNSSTFWKKKSDRHLPNEKAYKNI